MTTSNAILLRVFSNRKHILRTWMDSLKDDNIELLDRLGLEKLEQTGEVFLDDLYELLEQGIVNYTISDRPKMRDKLQELTSEAAMNGLKSTTLYPYIANLKYVLFEYVLPESKDKRTLSEALKVLENMLDVPFLYFLNDFITEREKIIFAQSRAISELSTPVIQIWDNVLAMPLIGEIDTRRAKEIMESLLEKIMETKSSYVLVDITGVPIVDTGVAESLIKTVDAARLLGAKCLLTGIRPEVAQTIVLLGVDLGGMITKATLKGGLAYILQEMNAEKSE